MTPAPTARSRTFYRAWYEYLQGKGWADRAYLYMLDEPNDPKPTSASPISAMV